MPVPLEDESERLRAAYHLRTLSPEGHQRLLAIDPVLRAAAEALVRLTDEQLAATYVLTEALCDAGSASPSLPIIASWVTGHAAPPPAYRVAPGPGYRAGVRVDGRASHDRVTGLRQDIAERGVVYAILVDEADTILDGLHRYEAARSLIPPAPYAVEMRAGISLEQKYAFARAVNLYRRHLTAQERRPVLEQLRGEGYSTRQIAEMAGVPRATVDRDLSTDAYASVDKSAAPRARVTGTGPQGLPSAEADARPQSR